MADPKIPPHMNPMTLDEVDDLLSSHEPVDLADHTMLRMCATLVAWAPIVKGNLPGSSVVDTNREAVAREVYEACEGAVMAFVSRTDLAGTRARNRALKLIVVKLEATDQTAVDRTEKRDARLARSEKGNSISWWLERFRRES